MSRESRQDRTVRGMTEQVTEHLHEFKILESSSSTKESEIEVWCQSFLKTCLAYTPSSGYVIKAQEARGKMRPDLVVLKGDVPKFVVEVKKLGFDLDKSDFRSGKIQLSEYLGAVGGIRWGILTNGCEWKLFDFMAAAGGVQVAYFDLKGDAEAFDITRSSVEDLCYAILDFHESTFAKEVWPDLSKEATAYSPESIARAVLSADVMRIIARSIKGEHEYRANAEVLTDRVFEVLQNGLDDLVPNWNEAKSLEFKKYIKSQKRASRKQRKVTAPKEASDGVTNTIKLEPSEPTGNEGSGKAA